MKTAHEALGVSTQFIADRCGVVVGRIWEYENPKRTLDVPEHAAAVMRALLTDWEAASDRLTTELRNAEGEGTIQRYVGLEAFYAAVPELDGWGALSQGLLLADVQRRVRMPIEYVA